MNNQQKLKLFWKITNHLNKKFCKNKIEINKIKIFQKGELHKSFPKSTGFYFKDNKSILIKKDEPLVMQIMILVHEFTHAYLHQIKKDNKRGHTKEGGRIYNKFMKETDKIIRILV